MVQVCKPYFGVGEDEYSINGHIAYMVVETKKALWDREKVKDAMDRSFEERQQWMVGGRVVSDIVERFPALKKREEVIVHFTIMNNAACLKSPGNALKSTGKICGCK